MNAIFLLSKIDNYIKDENGNKTPKVFSNTNQLLDNFKKYIKKYDNFLYVASVENNPEATDAYSKAIIESFKLTLPFKNYFILDGRNKQESKSLVEKADFIYLSGGHLPSANSFINNINLKELIKNNKHAIICGVSAGSMNCANVVYCPPELEGESLDPNFKVYLKGLNLTEINVLPHFNTVKDEYLDDKHFLNEIVLPHSYKKEILALDDFSYVLIDNGKNTIYGSAYTIKDGVVEQINSNENTLEI